SRRPPGDTWCVPSWVDLTRSRGHRVAGGRARRVRDAESGPSFLPSTGSCTSSPARLTNARESESGNAVVRVCHPECVLLTSGATAFSPQAGLPCVDPPHERLRRWSRTCTRHRSSTPGGCPHRVSSPVVGYPHNHPHCVWGLSVAGR